MALVDETAIPSFLYLLAPGSHRLDLLSNDLGGSSVIGASGDDDVAPMLNVNDAAITVDIPEDRYDDISFRYSVDDGGREAFADVTISILHLSNTTASVDEAASAQPAEFGPLIFGPEPEDEPQAVVLGVPVDLGVPVGLVGFKDLRYDRFHVLGMALMITLALLFSLFSRRGYVAVNNVPRRRAASTAGEDLQFHLRHDTEGVWATGRRRKGKLQIETPNGRTWIDESGISRHD